jgi:histidinol phosphatase-like PHP family hydrolase
MYNLHAHSLLSDGVLVPSEIAVRHAAIGYKAIAICDHADYSNIERVVNGILEFTGHWPKSAGIKVFPGIELTHLPLEQFKPLSEYARSRGIAVIIGHGETLVEPVIKGTNRAALEADIDILAHPGLITDEEAALAKHNGIFLEITSRQGHNSTNRHVVEKALKNGAKLIINMDSHLPEDLILPGQLIQVALAGGLTPPQIDKIYLEVEKFLAKKSA